MYICVFLYIEFSTDVCYNGDNTYTMLSSDVREYFLKQTDKQTDRQTDRQTDIHHTYFGTFA